MEDEKLKNMVEKLYKKIPETRNNNNLLVIKIIQELGFKIIIDIDDLMSMPQFEAITRIGRKLKEENPNYKGSDKAESRKQELEEEYHMKYSNYECPTDNFFNNLRSGLR